MSPGSCSHMQGSMQERAAACCLWKCSHATPHQHVHVHQKILRPTTPSTRRHALHPQLTQQIQLNWWLVFLPLWLGHAMHLPAQLTLIALTVRAQRPVLRCHTLPSMHGRTTPSSPTCGP